MSAVAPPSLLTFLLPPRARFDTGPGAAPVLARLLARGDPEPAQAGDEAQLQRVFDILPRGLPVAALTRQHDCHDAENATWMRADPAYVRADLGAGRLLACGELGLDRDQAEALLQPLKPLFGDAGCPISAGAASRWYLRLPRDARLPEFVPPHRVLGDDIFLHLPEGDAGRRWRGLLNEAQIVLHNHPLNAERIAAGKVPVNSLWFWGGGVLPDHVRCSAQALHSDDLLVVALAERAAVTHRVLPQRLDPAAASPDAVFDLRRLRSLDALEREWIVPAVQALGAGLAQWLLLDFGDGSRWRYRHGYRWRFWRRPGGVLAPAAA